MDPVDRELYSQLNSTVLNGDISVSAARNGSPTAEVKSILMHSSYDPELEAERLSVRALQKAQDDSIILIFGLGLGYLPEALSKHFDGRIIVVEPDLAMVRTAFENRDLEMLKNSTLLFGKSAQDTVQRIEAICEGEGGWDKVLIVQHAPSLKINPEYFSEVSALIRSRRNLSCGKLNILVATPFWGGSLPSARHCINAFRRLGHRVEVLDNSLYDDARRQIEGLSSNTRHTGQLLDLLHTLMSESITARALDRAVDLVFLVAQSPITSAVVQELHNRHIPIAFWFMEDWRVFTSWQATAKLFDYFFTIQKGDFLHRIENLGVKKAHYLPLAADPKIHKPMKLTPAEQQEYGSSVSHVGAGYNNRRFVFSGLTDIDFKLWGTEWGNDPNLAKVIQRNGEWISTEDSAKVYNATKVNINLHSSPFHEGVNPEGDYVNPRTFELAACGAFQLCDQRQLLGELFKDGEEIVTFRNTREIMPLIKYYLDNPAERLRIAERARLRVLNEHTYEARMAEVLRVVYQHETVPASHYHPNHINNLIDKSADDAELVELLSRFRDRGVITLDDIIEDIKQRHGELSRSEATFLLMHEFRCWAREKEAA